MYKCKGSKTLSQGSVFSEVPSFGEFDSTSSISVPRTDKGYYFLSFLLPCIAANNINIDYSFSFLCYWPKYEGWSKSSA